VPIQPCTGPRQPARSRPIFTTGDGFHKLRSGIGVEAVVAVSQGSNNKPSDELRILHCQLERDTCSHAVTEEGGMVNLELSDKRGRVLRHLGVGQRTLDVSSSAMRLLFNGDEPPGLRDTRDDRAEAGFDGRYRAM
jgi:hypothetical protein